MSERETSQKGKYLRMRRCKFKIEKKITKIAYFNGYMVNSSIGARCSVGML